MKSRRATNRSAFTFIEVLVALAIAAIALLGLLRLHLLSIASAQTAQATTEAVLLAQTKIAEVSAGRFPEQGVQSGTTEQNGYRFAWRLEISDAPSPDIRELKLTGLRQIQASVSWQRGSGHKRIQMTTYVADTTIHE